MKRSLLAQTAVALMALACLSAAQSAEPEKSTQAPDSLKPEEGLAGLVYVGNVLEQWAKHCRFDKMQSTLHASRLSLQASLQSTAKLTAPEPKRAEVQASLVRLFEIASERAKVEAQTAIRTKPRTEVCQERTMKDAASLMDRLTERGLEGDRELVRAVAVLVGLDPDDALRTMDQYPEAAEPTR